MGKSFLSLNLSAALASLRPGVVLADLDLGGANLHLMMGLNRPGAGLAEFLAGRSELAGLIRESTLPGLGLLPGASDSLGLANLLQWQKVKLINNLKKLPAEVVVMDLGAGSSFNTLDFYSSADIGILALTPEITSALNTYSFIKNLLYRKMLGALKPKKFKAAGAYLQKAVNGELNPDPGGVAATIREIGSLDAQAAEELERIVEDSQPRLILNMVDHPKQAKVAEALDRMSRKRLGFGLSLLGQVPYDPKVRLAVCRMRPLYQNEPDSPAGLALSAIAEELLPLIERARGTA